MANYKLYQTSMLKRVLIETGAFIKTATRDLEREKDNLYRVKAELAKREGIDTGVKKHFIADEAPKVDPDNPTQVDCTVGGLKPFIMDHDIPKHYKWAAMNEDGGIYAYTDKPFIPDHPSLSWGRPIGCKSHLVCALTVAGLKQFNVQNWKDTLMEINHVDS